MTKAAALLVAMGLLAGCDGGSSGGGGGGGTGGGGGGGTGGDGASAERERAQWPISQPAFSFSGGWANDAVTGLSWEQAGSEQHVSYSEAVARCEGMSARVPTLVEMQSIVDFAATIGARIDIDTFPDAFPAEYWLAPGRRVLDFSTGEAFSPGERELGHVRCVRGGRTAEIGYDVEGGVVTDRATGLRWEQAASGPVEAGAAAAHCGARETGGFTDWRLPSARELHSLIIDQGDGPQLDRAAFPDTPTEPFWTATPVAGSAGESWVVDFSGEWSGAVWFSTVDGFFLEAPRVRCVR